MRGHDRSALSDRSRVGNLTLSRFTGEYDLFGNQVMSSGQIRFDSIHRFKGQQAPAVILVDVDPDPERLVYWQKLLYCGMTRATVRLELVVKDDNPENAAFLAK